MTGIGWGWSRLIDVAERLWIECVFEWLSVFVNIGTLALQITVDVVDRSLMVEIACANSLFLMAYNHFNRLICPSKRLASWVKEFGLVSWTYILEQPLWLLLKHLSLLSLHLLPLLLEQLFFKTVLLINKHTSSVHCQILLTQLRWHRRSCYAHLQRVHWQETEGAHLAVSQDWLVIQ